MFTAQPDDTAEFFPALTRQVNYRFTEPLPAGDALERLYGAVRQEDVHIIYALTAVRDEPHVLVVGALNRDAAAKNYVYGNFSWSAGELAVCALDIALVPDTYAVGQTMLPVLIGGLPHKVISHPGFSDVPAFLPSVMEGISINGGVTLLIDGKPALAHISGLRESMRSDLDTAIELQSWPINELSTLGAVPYHPFVSVFIPLALYREENLPVDVLSFMFAKTPSMEQLRRADAAFSDVSYIKATDITVAVNAYDYPRFTKWVIRSMPQLLPTFAIMMLTQMTLWSVWLAGFAPLRQRLRILGATRLSQGVGITLSFFAMQALAAAAAVAAFFVLREPLRRERWLWTESLYPLWLALAGFAMLCAAYMAGHLLVTFWTASKGKAG